MLPASTPSLLQAFLDHPSRPPGDAQLSRVAGFLFIVVSVPELIPASEWLPIIFAEEDVDYETAEQAEAVIGQIVVTLSNTTNAAVFDPPSLLPAVCQLHDEVLDNFGDEAPIEPLCGGTGRFNG